MVLVILIDTDDDSYGVCDGAMAMLFVVVVVPRIVVSGGGRDAASGGLCW